MEGSLAELVKEDENCRQIIKNSSCLHRKLQHYIVLVKEI